MAHPIAHLLGYSRFRTKDISTTEMTTFDSLMLSEHVSKGLHDAGFRNPSPIQLKAIPLGRCGLDLIVQAKSGTGKTCVFSVISLESLRVDVMALQVLVLAPTREIAIQIRDCVRSMGRCIPGLQCHAYIGGMPVHEDRITAKTCQIAVGTPGRVTQLIKEQVLLTSSIRLFVMDEADKLLETGFQEQINWIYATLPANKQLLALSATYPQSLADHVTTYMRDPTFVRLNSSDPALLGIGQYYKTVPNNPLPNKVFDSKMAALIHILSSVNFKQCLIFSNYQTRAQSLNDALNAKGWPTAVIAGSLDQTTRNEAMATLKAFQCRILVSTDLTSRGIDAEQVNMVINLDMPHDGETYLHRIGRAGRYGTCGIAISLLCEGKEMTKLKEIETHCNTHIFTLPEPLPVDLVECHENRVSACEVLITKTQPPPDCEPIKQPLSGSDLSEIVSGVDYKIAEPIEIVEDNALPVSYKIVDADAKDKIVEDNTLPVSLPVNMEDKSDDKTESDGKNELTNMQAKGDVKTDDGKNELTNMQAKSDVKTDHDGKSEATNMQAKGDVKTDDDGKNEATNMQAKSDTKSENNEVKNEVQNIQPKNGAKTANDEVKNDLTNMQENDEAKNDVPNINVNKQKQAIVPKLQPNSDTEIKSKSVNPENATSEKAESYKLNIKYTRDSEGRIVPDRYQIIEKPQSDTYTIDKSLKPEKVTSEKVESYKCTIQYTRDAEGNAVPDRYQIIEKPQYNTTTIDNINDCKTETITESQITQDNIKHHDLVQNESETIAEKRELTTYGLNDSVFETSYADPDSMFEISGSDSDGEISGNETVSGKSESSPNREWGKSLDYSDMLKSYAKMRTEQQNNVDSVRDSDADPDRSVNYPDVPVNDAEKSESDSPKREWGKNLDYSDLLKNYSKMRSQQRANVAQKIVDSKSHDSDQSSLKKDQSDVTTDKAIKSVKKSGDKLVDKLDLEKHVKFDTNVGINSKNNVDTLDDDSMLDSSGDYEIIDEIGHDESVNEDGDTNGIGRETAEIIQNAGKNNVGVNNASKVDIKAATDGEISTQKAVKSQLDSSEVHENHKNVSADGRKTKVIRSPWDASAKTTEIKSPCDVHAKKDSGNNNDINVGAANEDNRNLQMYTTELKDVHDGESLTMKTLVSDKEQIDNSTISSTDLKDLIKNFNDNITLSTNDGENCTDIVNTVELLESVHGTVIINSGKINYPKIVSINNSNSDDYDSSHLPKHEIPAPWAETKRQFRSSYSENLAEIRELERTNNSSVTMDIVRSEYIGMIRHAAIAGKVNIARNVREQRKTLKTVRNGANVVKDDSMNNNAEKKSKNDAYYFNVENKKIQTEKDDNAEPKPKNYAYKNHVQSNVQEIGQDLSNIAIHETNFITEESDENDAKRNVTHSESHPFIKVVCENEFVRKVANPTQIGNDFQSFGLPLNFAGTKSPDLSDTCVTKSSLDREKQTVSYVDNTLDNFEIQNVVLDDENSGENSDSSDESYNWEKATEYFYEIDSYGVAQTGNNSYNLHENHDETLEGGENYVENLDDENYGENYNNENYGENYTANHGENYENENDYENNYDRDNSYVENWENAQEYFHQIDDQQNEYTDDSLFNFNNGGTGYANFDNYENEGTYEYENWEDAKEYFDQIDRYNAMYGDYVYSSDGYENCDVEQEFGAENRDDETFEEYEFADDHVNENHADPDIDNSGENSDDKQVFYVLDSYQDVENDDEFHDEIENDEGCAIGKEESQREVKLVEANAYSLTPNADNKNAFQHSLDRKGTKIKYKTDKNATNRGKHPKARNSGIPNQPNNYPYHPAMYSDMGYPRASKSGYNQSKKHGYKRNGYNPKTGHASRRREYSGNDYNPNEYNPNGYNPTNYNPNIQYNSSYTTQHYQEYYSEYMSRYYKQELQNYYRDYYLKYSSMCKQYAMAYYQQAKYIDSMLYKK